MSYDSVFLASVRMISSGEVPEIRRERCFFHPLRKRPVCADCSSLRFAAAASAVLTHAKVKDDLCDERGFKKFAARLASPLTGGAAKKALKRGGEEAAEINRATGSSLSRLAELEKAGSPSLDEAAGCFGDLTASVFSAGADGDTARILREIGRSTGRFIYAVDAADDAARDAKSKNYNPILLTWGEDALVKEGRDVRVRHDVCEAILRGVMLDLGRLPPAAELLCDGGGDPDLCALVRNIVYLGMPAEANRVLSKNAATDRCAATTAEGGDRSD